jgi:small subunit ribosomal protein S5
MAYEKGNRNSGDSRDGGDSIEKVVSINRCAKVVKGGRRFSFSALVITGDKAGSIGIGFGKANEVSDAIKKASEASRRRFVKVELRDATIPHAVIGTFGGGKVLLKPAGPGTGIIAGGGVRPVCEAAGIKDIIAKNLGSKNPTNVVKATIEALLSLRTKEQMFSARGKKLPEKKAL